MVLHGFPGICFAARRFLRRALRPEPDLCRVPLSCGAAGSLDGRLSLGRGPVWRTVDRCGTPTRSIPAASCDGRSGAGDRWLSARAPPSCKRAIAALRAERQTSASSHSSLPGRRNHTVFHALRLPLPYRFAKQDGDTACSPYLISAPTTVAKYGWWSKLARSLVPSGRKTCFHWYPAPDATAGCCGAGGAGLM